MKSSQLGTVTLGNQLDMKNEFVSVCNIFASASGYTIHRGGDWMNGDRPPNSIKHMSNDFSGFSFGGMHSFGNTVGDFHQKSAWDVGARYEQVAFKMGAAYTKLNNPYVVNAFDPYAMIGITTFLGQPTDAVDPAASAVTDLYKESSFPVDKQGTFAMDAAYTICNLLRSGDFTYTTIKGLEQTVAYARL